MAWDGRRETLAGAEAPRPLEDLERIDVARGMTGIEGDFVVFVGYRVGREVVYALDPTRFSVVQPLH